MEGAEGLLGPRGLYGEGGGHDLIPACELACGLGLLETEARVEGTVESFGAERTLWGGGWCGNTKIWF